MQRLLGQVALMTGATRDEGRASAEELAPHGLAALAIAPGTLATERVLAVLGDAPP
jgi:NAD(P)-dependent dehydrogenase (short-subunit alcohol dehydrogenase family)